MAIEVDSGWNFELAGSDIEKVHNRLNIDLITRVLGWNEYKGMQVSFLRSSTPDGEIPTDRANFAML